MQNAKRKTQNAICKLQNENRKLSQAELTCLLPLLNPESPLTPQRFSGRTGQQPNNDSATPRRTAPAVDIPTPFGTPVDVRMRSLLAEWERRSAIGSDATRFGWGGDPFDKVADKIADTVWELGPHAEPLVPDLERIVTANHLVNLEVRCYAAFALARFEPHRQTAKAYLKSLMKNELIRSHDLAYELLQRIDGAPKGPAATLRN